MATAVHNRPGSKAHARMIRMSASKARVVLNLIRGKHVNEAMEILSFSERLAADVIGKCLASAVANAEHNDDLNADELYVSACYADEGPTLKRFRPRARGRAGRIHKQTCHITVEVSRYTDDELEVRRLADDLRSEGRAKRSQSAAKKSAAGDRARRVAKSKAADEVPAEEAEDQVDEIAEDQVEEAAEVAEDTAEAAEEAAESADETAEDAVAEDSAADDVADDAEEAAEDTEEPAADDAEEKD
jgi:large subunit ribosomal protein L22